MNTLTPQDFKDAAALLNCEVAVIKAVAKVESNGSGFDKMDLPKTLFEGHWFHKFTGGKYSGILKYKSISYPRWTRIFYGKQVAEKERLRLAASLDRKAALKSTSWGMFQIMGFNYKLCGFVSVQQFVNAMYQSERRHLLAFCTYIKSRNLDKYLQAKNFAKFAYYYNGPSYNVNKYDKKMFNAYLKYTA